MRNYVNFSRQTAGNGKEANHSLIVNVVVIFFYQNKAIFYYCQFTIAGMFSLHNRKYIFTLVAISAPVW